MNKLGKNMFSSLVGKDFTSVYWENTPWVGPEESIIRVTSHLEGSEGMQVAHPRGLRIRNAVMDRYR